MSIQTIHAILCYIYYVLVDGDWANDFLTHIPLTLRPFWLIVGHLIAYVMAR